MVKVDLRFGPVIRRYCLCVVYYLWAYSFSDFERPGKISSLNPSLRRDLLGAVKPFIDEISAALDDPGCSPAEQRLLEDFAATYEAVLEFAQIPFERVEANWDLYQIPHDNRLNRALFGVLQGLELLHFQEQEAAGKILLPAWSKLVQIDKRRVLPMPLRQFLQESEEEVGRFDAEYRSLPVSLPPEEIDLEPSLPTVHDLMVARKQGQNMGLKHLVPREVDPEAFVSTGLVIDLEGQSEVSRTSSEPPRLPVDSVVEEPTPVEPSGSDLAIPLRGYRPLPSAAEAGEAMLAGSQEKPQDPSTLPPVHGNENPWEEISEAPHVLLEETQPGQSQLQRERDLFTELSQASPEAGGEGESVRVRSTASGDGPPRARQHDELAELFQDD